MAFLGSAGRARAGIGPTQVLIHVRLAKTMHDLANTAITKTPVAPCMDCRAKTMILQIPQS